MNPARPAQAMLTLDDVLPAPDFRERHQRHVRAPPQAVWEALLQLRLCDLALSRTLMGARLLPARLAGRPPAPMMTGRFLEEGPVPVLAAYAPRAVIAGGAMQPWKLTGGAALPSWTPTACARSTSRAGRRRASTSSFAPTPAGPW